MGWISTFAVLWIGSVVTVEASAVDAAAFARCRSMQSDVARLECFDGLAPSSAVAAAEEADPVREAIDGLLARSLNDPTSPIGYEVSDALPCRNIDPSESKVDAQCVCYVINAKNRLGGYTGDQISYARVFMGDRGAFALDLGQLPSGGFQACSAANLKPRSADFIRARIK